MKVSLKARWAGGQFKLTPKGSSQPDLHVEMQYNLKRTQPPMNDHNINIHLKIGISEIVL